MVGSLFVVVGLTIVALVLADVFQSVVLPRPANRFLRLSALLSRLAWRSLTVVGRRVLAPVQSSVLPVYASLMLVVFMAAWVVLLIFGYGLAFFGLRDAIAPRPETFGDALYFAGTTFLTIGYGDYHPISAATHTLSVIAGATGFAVIAVVATFLFSILGGFQQREFFIATVSQRVDATPTGMSLLLTVDRARQYDDLVTFFREARRWIAAVAESHLAYPILAYFRSTRERDSWVATLTAVMDTAALVIGFTESEAQTEAMRTLLAGRRLVETFVSYFGMQAMDDLTPSPEAVAAVRDALADAGYPMGDAVTGRQRFEDLHSSYRTKLARMSAYWLMPAPAWLDVEAVRATIAAAAAYNSPRASSLESNR